MQLVGMLTSLPMKSWHVTSIFAPHWLDKIVPSWKSYGKSKLLHGRSIGTSVWGIGRSKASMSMLADGRCLCNVHRWHIGWWVGAKRCSVGRCKAHRTHLITIYCKGRNFLPLKQCKLKGPNQMSPYGQSPTLVNQRNFFHQKKKKIQKKRKMFLFHLFWFLWSFFKKFM
jgi:hypothetical protein